MSAQVSRFESKKEYIIYLLFLVTLLAPPILIDVYTKEWNAKDWYTVTVLASATFFLSLVIRRMDQEAQSRQQADRAEAESRQQVLLERQQRLQESVADLELQEKIGCLWGRGAELLSREAEASSAMFLLSDARAAMFLLRYGSTEMRQSFMEALEWALQRCSEATDCFKNNNRKDVIRRVLRLVRSINKDIGDQLANSSDSLDSESLSSKQRDQLCRLMSSVGMLEQSILKATADDDGRVRFENVRDYFSSRMVRVRFEEGKLDHIENVDLRVETDLREIEGWSTPWYTDAAGWSSFDQRDSKPVLLGEIPRLAVQLSGSDRIRNIQYIRDHLQDQACFTVTTVRLENGRRLVIDGNHRLSATLIGSQWANVQIVELSISFEDGMALGIPDLLHHAQPDSSAVHTATIESQGAGREPGAGDGDEGRDR